MVAIIAMLPGVIMEFIKHRNRSELQEEITRLQSELQRYKQNHSTLYQKQVESIDKIESGLREIRDYSYSWNHRLKDNDENLKRMEGSNNQVDRISDKLLANRLFFPKDVQDNIEDLVRLIRRLLMSVLFRNQYYAKIAKYPERTNEKLLEKKELEIDRIEEGIVRHLIDLESRFKTILHLQNYKEHD